MRTREEMIAGIRQLADWLEANPDIPIPYDLTGRSAASVNIHASHGESEKAVVAAVARALPGRVAKDVWGKDDYYFGVRGNAPGGVGVNVIAHREKVCERIVTGTREVVEKVPAPDAPMIEVTRTEEIVEYRCGPILAAS